MKNKGLVFISLLSLLLSSCGNSKNRISLFLYDYKDDFISEFNESFNEIFNKEYDLKTYYASNSQKKQNESILEELDNLNNKFFVINLVDRTSGNAIIKKCKSKNVPVVFFNRRPLSNDLIYDNSNFLYVGSDPKNEGDLQAEIINDYFINFDNFKEKFDKNKNGKLDVVLIKGERSHQDAEIRNLAVVNTLTYFGYDVNIISSAYCDWNREKSNEYFESIYDEFKDDIDLVISNNDSMALGVSDYLKTLEYDKEKKLYEEFFPIVGIDGTKEGIESSKNGDLIGTVKNDAKEEAKAIYEVIKYTLNNEDFNTFPYEIDDNFILIKGYKIEFFNESNVKEE